MEIKISKENFLRVSLVAEKITGKNLNLPILNSFLISAQKGKMKITATNLDVSLEIYAPAKIENEGVAAVPSRLINSVFSNIKENITTLKQDGVNLKIITESANAVLKTNSLEDFPILPKFKKEKGFKININDFLSGLKSVFFAASVSYFKPEIASVYIHFSKNQIDFAATDSFRLMEKSVVSEGGDFGESGDILLPIKSAVEIIRILDEIAKQDKEIEINYNKNEILIFNDSFSFFSRLTEGVFPDYKQFIPKDFLGEAVLDYAETMGALKAAGVFLSRLNDITLEIYPTEEYMELKTANSDLGEYYSKMKIKINGFSGFKEEKIKLTLNLKYLLDGILRMPQDEIILKISDEGKPAVIKSSKDKNILYLVMPMKI